MDLYTPVRIRKVFDLSPKPSTFLRDTFFKHTESYKTKQVHFDVINGARKVAPYVNPKVGGKVVPNSGYQTKYYIAPLVAPEMVTEAEEMLDRIPGEQITSDMTPAERAVRKLSQDLVDMNEQIARREEVMCAEALFTGKIAIKGEGVDEEIDYGFTNKETVSKKWSASGSDPIADLRKWKQLISKHGHVSANMCIMSTDVVSAFINNAVVKELLDVRNYSLAKIDPYEIKFGINCIGTISALGLSIYSYDEWYLDDWTDKDNPVEKPFVPDGTVGLFSTAAPFSMLYGAITDFDPKTKDPRVFAGSRYPERFISSDNRVCTVRVSSRPLAVPHNLKSWYIAKVL